MRRALLNERREPDLRDDSTQLAHARAETMSRATHARGKDLSGCDERGGIRTKVEGELGEDVERKEMGLRKGLPCEAKHAEDDSENCEASNLNGLAAEFVDGEDGHPVAGKSAGAD